MGNQGLRRVVNGRSEERKERVWGEGWLANLIKEGGDFCLLYILLSQKLIN